MDIFRFNNPTSPTKMEEGEIVDGFRSKMWIERYLEPGEFEFVGYEKDGVRDKLPLDSVISHTDTQEMMIVENHEIRDDKGKEVEVTITGRSFETWLSNRSIGSNRDWDSGDDPLTGYSLEYATTWNQVKLLLEGHLYPDHLLFDEDDALPFFKVISTCSGVGTSEERMLKVGSLYSKVLEILAVDDLGIRSLRPRSNLMSFPGGAALVDFSVFEIHRGVDRTANIIFSPESGEIESADYLWSRKGFKNTAFVHGKWLQALVGTDEVGFKRRMIDADASDIDDYDLAPVGMFRTSLIRMMEARGKEALARQRQVELSKIDVSKTVRKSIFRKDYNVGDIITTAGEYGTSTKKRISEYVEIEDETGFSGYPTLTNYEETT